MEDQKTESPKYKKLLIACFIALGVSMVATEIALPTYLNIQNTRKELAKAIPNDSIAPQDSTTLIIKK